MQSVNQKTDRKRSKKQTDKKMDFRVLGTVEKRWGKLMCGHGHEGAVSLMKLPSFPQ